MPENAPKILVLGKGNLGNNIKQVLDEIGYDSLCIPIRSIEAEIPLACFRVGIIIDCMDLSHDQYTNYSALQGRILRLRRKFLSFFDPDKYYYVSSANLYVPSCEVIHESSQVYRSSHVHLTPYLKWKLKTEDLLVKWFKDRLTILRPVSLWSYELAGANDGFFADLVKSLRNKTVLPLRAGDKNIISYMSFHDAAKVIVYIALTLQKPVSICNITSWQWASRASLKSRRLEEPDFLQPGRRVSSLHYTKLELPFSLLHLL